LFWTALATAIKNAAKTVSNPTINIRSADKEINSLALKKNVILK
jgi:hypothetical protein